MTLNNKSWLKNEILRMYLSADSQESIGDNLKISVGTVSLLLNEILKSDDTIDLQRQIAIIARKKGVSIKQLAANLRWKNEIKKSGLDDKKVEKFLDAMDMMFNKYGITPTAAASKFYSIIEIMLRENIEPHKLEEEIKSKSTELQEKNALIEAANELLLESRAKVEKERMRLKINERDLELFQKISSLLELYGYSEISSEYSNVVRAMIDFKDLGYDPKVIVSKYEAVERLTSAIEKLKVKLQKLEEIHESYRRMQKDQETEWKGHFDTIKILEALIKDGLRKEDIFTAVHLINQDFPKSNMSQIMEDLRTYGSLAAAAWKLERERDAENEVLF